MGNFKNYLENVSHLGHGFFSEKVQKAIGGYLKGDYVGGYLGHEGRFKQLDLILEEIFLNGQNHISPKQLGEFLVSSSGRHIMDELTTQLEHSAKGFFSSRREEIIKAAKKMSEGDEE